MPKKKGTKKVKKKDAKKGKNAAIPTTGKKKQTKQELNDHPKDVESLAPEDTKATNGDSSVDTKSMENGTPVPKEDAHKESQPDAESAAPSKGDAHKESQPDAESPSPKESQPDAKSQPQTDAPVDTTPPQPNQETNPPNSETPQSANPETIPKTPPTEPQTNSSPDWEERFHALQKQAQLVADEHCSTISKLKETVAQQKEELQKEKDQSVQDIHQLNSNFQKVALQHEEEKVKIQKKNDEHIAILNSKITKHGEQMEKERETFEKKIETLKAAHDKKIQNLTSTHTKKMDIVTSTHTKKADNLTKKIETLTANHASKIQTLTANHTSKTESLTSKIESLTSKIQSLEDDLLSKEAQLAAARASHEELKCLDKTKINPLLVPMVEGFGDRDSFMKAFQNLNTKIGSAQSNQSEESKKFEEYKKKVQQWKKSVKQISRKDLTKIQSMKKQIAQQTQTIEELKNEIKDRFKPKNNQFDVIESIAIRDKVWAMVQYDMQSLGVQWVESEYLESKPETIQDKMEKDSARQKQTYERKIKSFEQSKTKAEEALETYKSRAKNALLNKEEGMQQLRVEREKETMDLQNQINELLQQNQDLQQDCEELKSLKIKLNQVTQDKESLEKVQAEKERSLTELNESFKSLTLRFETITSEKNLSDQEQEGKIQSLKEQLEREKEEATVELESLRQRNRKLLNAKESKISKLEKTIKKLKKDVEHHKQSGYEQSGYEKSADSVSSTSSTDPTPSTPEPKPDPLTKEAQLLRNIVGPANTHSSDQLLQLAKVRAENQSEIQDKNNHINILKSSLSIKSQEVQNLRDIEKQLKRQLEYSQYYKSQGAPNMEFLKNVFLKFFENDPSIKASSLKTMAQILNLSPDELQDIQQKSHLLGPGGLGSPKKKGWFFGR